MSAHPPAVTPIPAKSTAIITSREINSLGDAGDSSVPLSPKHVQAGRSQDIREEGSLFHVSPGSAGFLRPSGAAQQFPPDRVLLPMTLDDFSDSVLGDPITYAQCEQIPGQIPQCHCRCIPCHLDSLICWGSLRFRLCWLRGPPLVRRWGPLPSLLRWIWRTARCWRRACGVVRIGSRRTMDSRSRMGIQHLACSFIIRGSWSCTTNLFNKVDFVYCFLGCLDKLLLVCLIFVYIIIRANNLDRGVLDTSVPELL